MKKTFTKGVIEKAGEKTYRFLASSSSVDRQGDSIDQSGWEMKNYMNNPVILWAHRYDELPLGKAILAEVTSRGLEIEVEFATQDENPKAEQVKKLVESGVLSAVSVGFIPKERNGNIITRAELLEVSVVPVPANQDALALAYKQMDLSLIQKDIQEVLEAEEKAGRVISKKNREMLETARDAMKNSLSEIEKLLELGVATTEDEDLEEGKNVDITIQENDLEKLKRFLRNGNSNISDVLAILKKL